MRTILVRLSFCFTAVPAFSSTLFTTDPPGISVNTFTSGLNFPTSLFQMGDGSVLVGTTTPSNTPGFTNFYTGSGQVVRFTQTNGVADGPGTPVILSLPGATTSVRPLGNLVAVASAGNGTFAGLGSGDINFFKPGANPSDAYAALGGLHFSFSAFDAAINLTMATTPGASPGTFDVYFILGAGNTTGTPVPGGVAMTGLASGTLAAGSLYKVAVDTTGPTPTVGQPVQLANGIRNSGGILIAPNGDIYFDDNGNDDSGPSNVSVDELNRLTAAQAASGTVLSFGYPNSYTDPSGNFVGGLGVPALANFLADATGDMVGVAEMALAPSNFPAGLNNGIFLGFHGEFTLTGVGNVSNPVVYYSFDTNTYTRFITGGMDGIGHLDGLWSTPDALYLADFATTDGFPAGGGVVYELTSSTPEPATAVLVLGGIAVGLLGLRRSQS